MFTLVVMRHPRQLRRREDKHAVLASDDPAFKTASTVTLGDSQRDGARKWRATLLTSNVHRSKN